MADYSGSECLICNEKFKENDDIVVCPECGTPYHRECYLKEGKCINTALHEKNEGWSKSQNGTDGGKKCPSCSSINKPHSIICENCGTPLVDNLNFRNQSDGSSQNMQNNSQNINYGGISFDMSNKYCGLDPDEQLAENVTVSDTAEFVDSNVPYYLVLFKRMKETGKKISFNFICLIFPEFYFANRKMWKAAVITMLISVLLSVPDLIYMLELSDFHPVQNILPDFDIKSSIVNYIISITDYMHMAFRVIVSLFANWLYYRHSMKKINQIKNSFDSDNAMQKEMLAAAGGTDTRNIIIMFIIEAIIVGGMVFALIYI